MNTRLFIVQTANIEFQSQLTWYISYPIPWEAKKRVHFDWTTQRMFDWLVEVKIELWFLFFIE